MTTESEQVEQASADQAAQEAGFSAGFSGDPIAAPAAPKPAVEAAPEPVKNEAEEKKEPEPAPTAPTPEPTPAPFDAQAEIRKLHGRIGELNSHLQDALKAKEAEGKPATLTPVELKRMKEQYPELAGDLTADLSEMLAGMAPKPADPKEIDTLVSQRVQSEMASIREAAVTDRHEHWKTDLWVDGKLGETRTPDYIAWLNSLPAADASAFETSANPYFVGKKLDAFYAWKTKTNQKQAEKQDRLKAAVQPQGVLRAGPQTVSDEEAMRKGFAEGFNS